MLQSNANGSANFEPDGIGASSTQSDLALADDKLSLGGNMRCKRSTTLKAQNFRFKNSLNLIAFLLVIWITEAPSLVFSDEYLGSFIVNASLLGGSYFRFGSYDPRSCNTILDSIENNRASYVYLGGRTKSRTLVEGNDNRHTNCYSQYVGYIAKFNSGSRNFTKYFHGTSSDVLLDVPVLRLAGNIDTGDTYYTNFIAGIVRTQSTQIVFMLDAQLGEIVNMWQMENHWVSTHKMFHYRNFEFAWVTGSNTDSSNYRIYIGLTRSFPQPSGWRYWRVRYYTQANIREIRSEDHNYYFGCTVTYWHQGYMWTAGTRDWSGIYGMPMFAKFHADLSISDAYQINTGNYFGVEAMHAQRGGRNYKMFGIATGHYKNGGDRFNQSTGSDVWHLFYFDYRFATGQFGCDVFFEKQIYPYAKHYGRMDQISGTTTLYFFGYYWDGSYQSRWKSFQTQGWTSRPWRSDYRSLWYSYCRWGYNNYKSGESYNHYEWYEPNCGGSCFLARQQLATAGASTTVVFPYWSPYHGGNINSGNYAVVVQTSPSHYTTRGYYNVYYNQFSQRTRYQKVDYFRGGCCSYTPGTYTVTAQYHFMITPSSFRKNQEMTEITSNLYHVNDFDVHGVTTKTHNFKYSGSNIPNWGNTFVLLQDHLFKILEGNNQVTTLFFSPLDNQKLNIKRQTGNPYYSATMTVDTGGTNSPFTTSGRNGARFDFYIMGKSGSTWYNARNLLEIRNDNKTYSITSPNANYELVYQFTSSINTYTTWTWSPFVVHSGKTVTSGSNYLDYQFTTGVSGEGFYEYIIDWPSTAEKAIGNPVMFPKSNKSERYRYLFCWRKQNNCRDLQIDRSISTLYPRQSNGAERGMPGGHNGQNLPAWPGANFTFNIVGKTIAEPAKTLSVPVRVIITNCGSITITTNGAIPPQVYKKSVHSTMASVRFSQFITARFTSNNANCPVYRYTMRDTTSQRNLWTNVNVTEKYLDYVPNAGLSFNRNTPAEYNFYVRAQAVWANVYKELPIQIRICGTETINVDNTTIHRVYQLNTAVPDLVVQSSVFDGNYTVAPSGDLCQIDTYGVQTNNRTFGLRGRIGMKRNVDRSQALVITRSKPIAQMTFNLTARTMGLVLAVQQYNFSVCDQKSLVTANRTFELNYVYHFKSNNTSTKNMQIIQFAEYKDNFVVNNCTLCPISNYRIINYRAETPYTGTDIIVNTTTNNIEIDTDKPIYQLLGVEAYYGNQTTTDCHFIEKRKFPLKIKVCGDEDLNIVNRTTKVVDISMGIDRDFRWPVKKLNREFAQTRYRQCKYHTWLAPNLTVTEENLKTVNSLGWKYSDPYHAFMQIQNKTYRNVTTESLFINHTSLEHSQNWFNLTRQAGERENFTLPMYLRATSMGKRTAFRKIIFNFNYPWKNAAPRIKGMKKTLEVKVTQEQQEEGFDNKYVSYTSPKARDKEGDKPIIKAKGYDLIPCKCVTFLAQIDGAFKLELDKSKLTVKDTGRWEISIGVMDEYYKLFRQKNMYRISVVIDYKETVKTDAVLKVIAAKKAHKVIMDTFEKPVDNSTVEVPEHEGEAVGASEGEWQDHVSDEEMSNVLDSYEKDLEELQRKIHKAKELAKTAKKEKKAKKLAAARASGFKGIALPDEEEEKEPEPPKDVEVKVGGVDRSGNIKMKFNQPLAVPGFIDQGDSSDAKARRLVALSELNVARDIMDVTFVKTSEGDKEQSFFLTMNEWTEEGMKIHMNMTNPLDVSKGGNGDGVQIGLKNPSLFVSKATGKPISKAKTQMPASSMPRQLPHGISEQSIMIQAKSAFIGMSTIFVVQVCLQKYLKGSMAELMTLFFTLQLICYMQIYDVPIPSNAEIYIEQFTTIIELQFLQLEPIVQMFLPDFKIVDYTTNLFVAKLQQYIFIGAIFLAATVVIFFIGILCFPFKWCKENFLKRSGTWCSDFFFNGIIVSLSILYLPLCMMTADSLEDILLDSSGLLIKFKKDLTIVNWKDENVITTLAMCGSLMLLPMIFYMVLRKFKDRLAEPSIKRRIYNLYVDISMNEKDSKLSYYPVFLFKRLTFVIIPSVFYWAPYFQLQALVFLTYFYILFYGMRRPHNDRQRINLELANESMFMIMNYHMISFSNFNTSDEMQFMMGYSFVVFIILTIMMNLVYLIKQQMKAWKNLGNLIEEKEEKIQAKIDYDQKLDVAKDNMVKFMVEDIQKQMQAAMIKKFQAQNKASKKKKQSKPLDTIAEESVQNLEGLVDGDDGQNAYNGPPGPRGLAKMGRNTKKGAVMNLDPKNAIQEEESGDMEEIDETDLFKLAEQRNN